MPNTPSVNPTPKARFQESNDNIAKHHKLVDSTEYQRAIDFSLLEYQKNLSMNASDPNAAMTMGVKISGVLEFLTVMKQLGDPPQVYDRRPPKDNLPNVNHPLEN